MERWNRQQYGNRFWIAKINRKPNNPPRVQNPWRVIANVYKMKYFVVKYSGPFGFIKPWTAVRDSETFSQQFLTPSIVEGIEKKLFPNLLGAPGIQKIVGHRLSYDQVSGQQEVIQTRGWNSTRKGREF